MEDRFQVGIISSTHGLKGEVKVFPTTDDSKRFSRLKEVILETGREEKLLNIEHVKYFKKMVILKFREYSHINEVEGLKGLSLFVTRENAVKLKKDEYFIGDIIGLRAVCEDGTPLGPVIDVIQTGANDVYVVEMEDGKELLLPAIKECVRSIHMEERIMKVHLMDGLL